MSMIHDCDCYIVEQELLLYVTDAGLLDLLIAMHDLDDLVFGVC